MKSGNFWFAFLLCTIAICRSATAQMRYVDLEVVGVSPSGEVKNGAKLPLVFKMINHGPDDEIDSDVTFYRLFQVVNRDTQQIYTGSVMVKGRAAGESSTYRDNYVINSFNFPDLKETIAVDFCFEIGTQPFGAEGDTLGISRRDTNLRNNVNCTVVTVHPRTTTIEEAQAGNQRLTLCPNPASQVVTLRYMNALAGENVRLCIMDGTGRTISVQNVAGSQEGLELSVADLPVGMYIVQLQTSTGLMTQPLMILR